MRAAYEEREYIHNVHKSVALQSVSLQLALPCSQGPDLEPP